MTQATVLPYIGTFRGAVRNHSPQANGYSVEVRPMGDSDPADVDVGFLRLVFFEFSELMNLPRTECCASVSLAVYAKNDSLPP